MLDIILDAEYKLISDSRNYTLQKVGQVKEGDNKGDETIVAVGYYGSIENALKAYKGLLIRNSDIKTIEELLAAIKEIDKKIEIVLRGN